MFPYVSICFPLNLYEFITIYHKYHNPQISSASQCPGGGEHFNFRIPRGVVPGQIVKIQVPDGRYLPLLIPNYKFAGDAQLKRKLLF